MWKCWLFGHDWKYPTRVINSNYIRTAYRQHKGCTRCGKLNPNYAE